MNVTLHFTKSASQRLSLRVGAQLRLFHILAEQDGSPVSAAELAEHSKAEVLLISMYHSSTIQSRIIQPVPTYAIY